MHSALASFALTTLILATPTLGSSESVAGHLVFAPLLAIGNLPHSLGHGGTGNVGADVEERMDSHRNP